MRRKRPKHRGLSAVAMCALFAAMSNVRNPLDTDIFLGSLPASHSSDSADYSPTSSLFVQNDYASTDSKSSHGPNDTVFAPRVVVLSALDFPPYTIVTNDLVGDGSRMEMSEAVLIDDNEEVYRNFEREWYEDCEPVTKKSNGNFLDVRSNCNTFHELNLVDAYGSSNSGGNRSESAVPQDGRSRIEWLGEGSWRSVWKLITNYRGAFSTSVENNNTVSDPNLVLKLLHTNHDYNKNSFSNHQVDAFAMEALSASNYVVDSFGFCGQSVITEAATTSVHSLIKTKTLSSIDRLRIARDLARGLADLHTLIAHPWEKPKTNNAHADEPLVFAHHDINPANLISVRDGQIRWNDFNLGLVNRQYAPRRETKTNDGTRNSNSTECPVPVIYDQFLWNSPEVCRNYLGTIFLDIEATGRNTAAQAADVYSLGNLLFYILARHQPWSHLEEDNTTSITGRTTIQQERESLLAIAKAKIEGRIPNLPERYRKRPGAKMLWEAVKMCYTYDPRLRPTAQQVAGFLEKAHTMLLHSKKEAKRKSGQDI